MIRPTLLQTQRKTHQSHSAKFAGQRRVCYCKDTTRAFPSRVWQSCWLFGTFGHIHRFHKTQKSPFDHCVSYLYELTKDVAGWSRRHRKHNSRTSFSVAFVIDLQTTFFIGLWKSAKNPPLSLDKKGHVTIEYCTQ